MAVSLGFGVLFATAISLVMVPVGYLILEDVQALRRKFFLWWRKEETEDPGKEAGPGPRQVSMPETAPPLA